MKRRVLCLFTNNVIERRWRETAVTKFEFVSGIIVMNTLILFLFKPRKRMGEHRYGSTSCYPRHDIKYECLIPPPAPLRGVTASSRPRLPHYRGLTITLRHIIVGRTALNEWSARCRDVYLTTHNTHERQASMPPPEFVPRIPASEQLQTHALDRAATGIGV
jgi:hypothetical protein